MLTPRKRINYINNADLLKEIHHAKMSYCYVSDKQCYDYDIITDDIRNINSTLINEGLETRKKRLSAELLRTVQKERNCTPKAALEYVDQNILESYNNHTVNDVIIRVMTDEHIPADDSDESKTQKTNFKPFKHYQLQQKGHLDEVVRSHWKGSIESGKFCTTHGILTNELGKMFIVLCDRIGMRSNYRNYSFLDEMKGDARFMLTKNALLFDESRVTVQLNPFAYYTTIVNHAFAAVLNSEKRSRNLRDDLLEGAGYDPSTTRIIEYEIAMASEHLNKTLLAKNTIVPNPSIFDWNDEEFDTVDDSTGLFLEEDDE